MTNSLSTHGLRDRKKLRVHQALAEAAMIDQGERTSGQDFVDPVVSDAGRIDAVPQAQRGKQQAQDRQQQ